MTAVSTPTVPGATAPAPPLPNRRRWWALGVLGLCTLVLNLDLTVLSVGLTTISRELHASTAQLQWMTAAYSLTMSGLMLASGALGDRWGRKRVLLTGLVLFGLASLGGAWSPNADGVIVARALMGIGASVVMPLAMSLLRTMFEPREQGRAIGIWTASVALGMPLGPIIGGLLLDHFWWGSIFLLNAVAVAIAVPLGAIMFEESRNPAHERIDLFGIALSAAGVAALTYGLIKAQDGWTAVSSLGWIAAGVALLAVFVATQHRATSPLVNLTLFREREFSGAVTVLVLSIFAMLGVLFVVPLYLQGVLGFRPLAAGLRLLPLAAGVLVSSVTADRAVRWFGPRWVVCGGMVLSAGGLGLLSLLTPSSGTPLIAAGLALAGGGMGFAMSPTMAVALSTIPRQTAGSASAVINAIRNVGGVLGVAVVGSAVSTLYTHDLPKSVDQLPPGAAGAVHDSVALVSKVAATMGGSSGAALREAAFHAFTDGMGIVLLACAGVALLTGTIAAAILPGRTPAAEKARPTAHKPSADQPAGIAS
jgi:EmrB/QacA subfamily drug resistance transporter